MKIPRFVLSLAAALAVDALAVATARADIAATEYRGGGITAVDAPGIRMVSARVDITWGEPGTLTAVFVMNNEDAGPADVLLGFPVSIPPQFRKKHGLDFTMSFDGVPADRASIRQFTFPEPVSKGEDGYHLPNDSFISPETTLWFHCRHRFPPGPTTVKVETKLPAIAAGHLPYGEAIEYSVRTGSLWKGKIGSEEIVIHFPRPISPGQIVECWPASGTVEGNTVRWQFESFKPKEFEYDIDLVFLEPDVAPILADLRRQCAEAPGDARKSFELIKHLFALCLTGPYLYYPPARMSKDEFRELLAMLKSDKDRVRFRQLYVWGWDGHYRQKSADWTRDSDEIMNLLRDTNYVPRYMRSQFLTEGRNRLARHLKEHPHDADAWNLYLLQSIGWEPGYGVYPFHMDQIQAALRHCPNDPTLRLWDSVCQWERHGRNLPGSPDEKHMLEQELQLRQQLEKRGFRTVRYRRRADDYSM